MAAPLLFPHVPEWGGPGAAPFFGAASARAITGAGLSLRIRSATVQAVPATYRSPGARQYGTHALDRV
eukprot:scaffold100115_cov43-Phaeocystis_antarctica.AAC.1